MLLHMLNDLAEAMKALDGKKALQLPMIMMLGKELLSGL